MTAGASVVEEVREREESRLKAGVSLLKCLWDTDEEGSMKLGIQTTNPREEGQEPPPAPALPSAIPRTLENTNT